MPFCTQCGTKLETDAKFCPSCGQAVSQGQVASVVLLAKPKHRPLTWYVGLALIVFACWGGLSYFGGGRDDLLRTQAKDTPERQHAAISVVIASYTFSDYARTPTPDLSNSGRWNAFSESSDRCNSGNCYYVSYHFQIVDGEGDAHEVECDWDVDLTHRTAVPRNAQARHYFGPGNTQ